MGEKLKPKEIGLLIQNLQEVKGKFLFLLYDFNQVSGS